jgi:Tfp pilus assembly protein PilV
MINNMNKRYIQHSYRAQYANQRGFTLIETFIAVMILIMAVVGPLTIAQRALSSSEFSQERITAYYLAQDAIEYVSSIRDNIGLAGQNGSGTSWIEYNSTVNTNLDLSNLTNCEGANNFCKIDYSQASGARVVACGASCPAMTYDSTTHSYGYTTGGTWSTSNFTRTIHIVELGNQEALVTVTVAWQSSLPGANAVTLTGDLFNWH